MITAKVTNCSPSQTTVIQADARAPNVGINAMLAMTFRSLTRFPGQVCCGDYAAGTDTVRRAS
jgi:hypothetical protein